MLKAIPIKIFGSIAFKFAYMYTFYIRFWIHEWQQHIWANWLWRERPTTNKEMKTKPYADPQANMLLSFVKYLTLHNPQALDLTEWPSNRSRCKNSVTSEIFHDNKCKCKVRSQKKNDIIWEFFPTWGGGLPKSQNFCKFTKYFLYAKFILRC